MKISEEHVKEAAEHAALIFGTTSRDILSRSLYNMHAHPRQAVCAALVLNGARPFPVGRVMGLHHQTVGFAVTACQERAATNEDFAQRFNRLRSVLAQGAQA